MPDILKDKNVYLTKGKFLCTDSIEESFEQKSFSLSSESYTSEHFMMNIYPALVKECCFLSWRGDTLQVSTDIDQHPLKTPRMMVISKVLKLFKSEASSVILPRFYHSFLEELKRDKCVKEWKLFQMSLVINDHKEVPEKISLHLRFEKKKEFYVLFEEVRSKFRISNLRIPTDCCFNLSNPEIRTFIEREFCCKINSERNMISLMPHSEERLRKFLDHKQKEADQK